MAAIVAVVVCAGALTALAPTVPAGATAAQRIRCSPTTTPCEVPAELAAKITEYTAAIAERLGRPLPFTPTIAIDTGRGPRGTMAEAEPADPSGAAVDLSSGPAAGCLITIYEGSLSARETGNTIAHELFHCSQYALDAGPLPAWFAEGTAEWVGMQLGGPDSTTRGNWDDWLRRPEKPLFARSYDAMGFFSVLDQQGLDPWTVFDPMQQAAGRLSSQGMYNLVKEHLGEEPALDVAQATTRQPSLGADWESTGPGITRTRATYEDRLAAGSSQEYRIPIGGLYGTSSAVLRIAGDVLTLSGADGLDTAVAFPAIAPVVGRGLSGSWCIKAGGCVCPAGSSAPDLLVGAPGEVGIALAQPDDRRGDITFTAETRTLDDWCSGGPLDLAKLCDLVSPAEAAALTGLPAAAGGSQLVTINKRNAYCAYPNDDGRVLVVNGFRSKNVERDFARQLEFTPGIRETPVAIGNGGQLQYHGASGNDLLVKVNGGYLVIGSGETTPPAQFDPDWVDERLGAGMTELAALAVSRIGAG